MKFRFGVMTRGNDVVRVARTAEDLGYSCLSIPDHFGDQAAPMPALAAAAVATNALRLAPLVLCNDFKHPVMLAKEAATLDVISGGRLELGLGAGWMKSDYTQSGIVMEPAGLRIERLAEAIQVIRGLWGAGRCRFSGKYYQVDMEGFPKPAQASLPLFVGGGGRKMLTLAGQEADIVGINLDLRSGDYQDLATNFAAEACEQKVGWVRACGRKVELNMMVGSLAVTADAESALRRFSLEMETPLEILRESPHVLAGSVSQLVDLLQARRERWGLSYVTIREDVMEAFAPVVAHLV